MERVFYLEEHNAGVDEPGFAILHAFKGKGPNLLLDLLDALKMTGMLWSWQLTSDAKETYIRGNIQGVCDIEKLVMLT
jgi:hypothetical protein